jgi:hypothetical protein
MDYARAALDDIEGRLQPKVMRSQALARLDELFRAGRVPDSPPDGFLEGRPLAVSASELLDRLGRRLGEIHMPWLGKVFDREAGRGVNVLTQRARPWMRILWPSYVPERELAERIEAFPFRTWVGSGAVDPQVGVLKIDYDSETNPDLVRRVVDEVVELSDGLYLGKVLFRWRFVQRPIGFFSLRAG